MFRLIYNLLWPVGLVVFLPRYLLKMFRRGGYREKFGQRLGFYGPDVRALLAIRPLWLHAVSVGEVAVALKLAAQLRAIEPEQQFILTTTTTTGFAFARKNAQDWIEVMYSPLDFWPVMRRAFAVIRPNKIVLVEAEVWPNLVAFAHARGIPVALVNARLSPRSEKRFRRFRFLVRPIFRLLDLVCVPDEEDVERWRAFGIDPRRMHCTGSIKYDPRASEEMGNRRSPAPEANFLDRNSLILFGGSTHPGEETLLARVFLNLRPRFPGLLLFIAPRHVERVREIRRQLEGLSLQVRLVSDVHQHSNGKPDCVLLDKTGELRAWYSVATIVFVGKSLTAHGGQNPAEPVTAGVPVIFGPHMENFGTLAQALVSNHGAMEVGDEKELEDAVDTLLRDATGRGDLVKNAEQVLNRHRGATARTAALVAALRPYAPRPAAVLRNEADYRPVGS